MPGAGEFASPSAQLPTEQAIRRLKAEFTIAVDLKRWAAFEALFTEDALIDYSRTQRSWGKGVGPLYAGPAAFAKDVQSLIGDALTVHRAELGLIDIESAEKVRATWRMEDIVVRSPESDRPGGHGYGIYEEEYRLTAAGWRISALTFMRLCVLGLAAR